MALQGGQIDDAVFIHLEEGDGFAGDLGRFDDGRMLHEGDDEALHRRALDGHVVRFRSGAGEDDFLRPAVQQGGHAAARILDDGARLLAKGVRRGRVERAQRPDLQHGLARRIAQGRVGVPVHVCARNGHRFDTFPVTHCSGAAPGISRATPSSAEPWRGALPPQGPDCASPPRRPR